MNKAPSLFPLPLPSSPSPGRAGKEGPDNLLPAAWLGLWDPGVQSEAPGTHRFIHSSSFCKRTELRLGMPGASKTAPCCRISNSGNPMQQIQAASVGPAGAQLLGPCLGSPIRWYFTGFASQTQPQQLLPPQTCFSLSFPIPTMKNPSTLPDAQANNLLWALSFMPHF